MQKQKMGLDQMLIWGIKYQPSYPYINFLKTQGPPGKNPNAKEKALSLFLKKNI